MAHSNQVAARILSAHGCVACTDVTGFGLLGHLIEMIKFEENPQDPKDDVFTWCDGSTECTAEGGAYNGDNGHMQSNATNDTGHKILDSMMSSITGGISQLGLQTSMQNGPGNRPIVMLNLNAIPVLEGAAECLKMNVLSSLYPENARAVRAVANPEVGASHPAYPLLYDPQTSGGLLAVVPSKSGPDVVASLRNAGYEDSAIIGHVTSSSQLNGFMKDIHDDVHVVLSTN